MPLVKLNNCGNCGMDHEWVFEGMSLKELRTVKQFTGMRTLEFSEAVDVFDADAIIALLYVLHKRDDINVRFEDVDADLADFSLDETEGEKREREDAEAAAKAASAPKPKPKTQSGRKNVEA